MRISPTASWPEWQQCGWVEKQEEDRQTIGSSNGQCLCVRVCLCSCVCLSRCICSICVDPLRYVLARILLNIQKRWWRNTDRLPCQERALAVSWWGRLAVTACVGVGYGSTINRPHDGKTSGQRPVGNFIQAQSLWENLIMHGLCFLGSAARLLFWMSLWRMNVLWKCTDPSVVIEYTPTEATLCLLELRHAFITTPETKLVYKQTCTEHYFPHRPSTDPPNYTAPVKDVVTSCLNTNCVSK